MNIIQEKIIALETSLNEFIENKRINGHTKEEISQLIKQEFRPSVLSQLQQIQSECESLGHSIVTLNKTDGIILSNDKIVSQQCEYCKKQININ